MDYSYSMAFFEELGRISSGGIVTAITVQSDMLMPALANYGSEELKQEYLVPTIAGDYVGCVGVSEVSGGSDVAALRTYAKRDGDDWIINGSKMWISNGAQADWMNMLCNTREGPVHRNKSIIIVPMKAPGVTVARKIDKMGLRCSDTAEIYFDNVRVPGRNLIGEEGAGFMYQMMQFQDERLCASAVATEGLNYIIQECIEYCRQRETFDMPLIDNQYVHFTLAELQSEVELLKSLIYRAAGKCFQFLLVEVSLSGCFSLIDLMIEGEDTTYLASIAKLKAGRLSRIVADKCLQFYGGMGFTNELRISRAYRDGRVTSIAGGTDEMMLGIISKMMGILPGKKRASDKKLANKN